MLVNKYLLIMNEEKLMSYKRFSKKEEKKNTAGLKKKKLKYVLWRGAWLETKMDANVFECHKHLWVNTFSRGENILLNYDPEVSQVPQTESMCHHFFAFKNN